jgi:hypothetical protein
VVVGLDGFITVVAAHSVEKKIIIDLGQCLSTGNPAFASTTAQLVEVISRPAVAKRLQVRCSRIGAHFISIS